MAQEEPLEKRCILVKAIDASPTNRVTMADVQLALEEGFKKIIPIPGCKWLVSLPSSECLLTFILFFDKYHAKSQKTFIFSGTLLAL